MEKHKKARLIFFGGIFLAVLSYILLIDQAPTAHAQAKSGSIITYSRVGKPGPIYASYKVINGQKVCAKKNDHPQKSNHNRRNHIDTECCLDPDEIPNSLCYYPPVKYGYLIQRYLNSLGR